MKILSQGQVLALLNKEAHPSIIDEQLDAIHHEERLRLHSETQLNLYGTSYRAFEEFMSTVPRTILPPEKYDKFKSLITFPFPTVEVTDSAYNELYKVFFGQNRVVEFRFDDNHEELEEDWLKYRKKHGFNDWFKLEGWNVYKNHINAPLVIDLPPLVFDEDGRATMTSDKPEPFFFWVPTENLIDLFNDAHNNTHYVLYQQDAPIEMREKQQIDKIAYYVDSERYASYVRKNDVWTFVTESTHDLDYAPVKSFWFKPLRNSRFQRQNSATANLGALDWMFYSMISKRNLDLYAGFPIISVYEQQCNYRTADGFHCEEGFIQVPSSVEGQETSVQACPKCSETQMIGPGSTITLPLPDPDNDSNVNLMPGVTVTNGDTASLKQMNEEIDRQKRELMIHMTGFDSTENSPLEPSKNKSQVMGQLESRHTLILELKEGFEIIEKFVNDTAARLRYGDKFIGSVVNYGSRFFLKTEGEMQADYEEAKKNGMPAFELENMRAEIYKKKYASDPKILHRVELLSQLEPYRDYTVKELQGMVAFISPEDLSLKIAFNDLIARFERENGPLELFLREVPMEVRIETISATLRQYLSKQDIPAQDPDFLTSNKQTNGGGNNETLSKQKVRT